MITKLTSAVPQGVKRMGIAAYIDRAWPFIGRNRITELLKKKDVRINDIKSDGTALVNGGDTITLFYGGKYDNSLNIFYDDGFVLAFIKPAGLPVDSDMDGIGEDTVLTRLHLTHPDSRLVHRLDTGTGGVMLAACNEKAEEYLTGLFKNHMLSKHYYAEVLGRLNPKHADLKAFLLKDAKHSTVRVTAQGGQGAYDIETIYTVIKEKSISGQTVSCLDVEIPTGRTHQIRAHMAYIGHPLVGDDKYGDRNANKLMKADRIVLSCRSIAVKQQSEAGKYAGMSFVCPEEV